MSDEIINVDLTGVEAGAKKDYSIPNGEYVVQVQAVTQKTAKPPKAPNPYIELTLEIMGDVNGNEVECMGNRLWHICSLQPKALFNLKKTLIALGQPSDGKLAIVPSELVGLWMLVEVKNEMFNEKLRPKVKEVAPLPTAEEQAAEQSPTTTVDPNSI